MALENLRKWKNGEVINARDYVYERDSIVSELNDFEFRIDETVDEFTDRVVDVEGRVDVVEATADTNTGRITSLEQADEDFISGAQEVGRAINDGDGREITKVYFAAGVMDYNPTSRAIKLKAYNAHDEELLYASDAAQLPLATSGVDGLMPKADKVKVDNIASDIASAVSTHNDSETSHLYLRTIINNLQEEIDRLNAKGRSWGEIDKTYSELVAMGEPTASEYISDYLAVAFGHTPSEVGDLIYTKVSATEPEYEMEFNGSLWISNGAYLVSKASNTQMGLVQGDLTYVSILNGLIQVLKSDYATNVGSSGASYDYDDLLALFTEVANDIYKKNETYSATQIEQRITDLLGLANLQDTAIEYETGNYVFPRGAVFPATLVSDYNWVFLRFITAGQEVRYNFFKPTEASSGNYMTVIIQKAPARYARIMRDNGNLKFDIVDDTNTVQTDLACTMKMWGVKLDGITAEEVSYDNTGSTLQSATIQGAIDEHDREIEELKYAPIINKSYGDKINATTDFVPNANGKPLLKQVDGMQVYAPQLVTNGDFSNGTTGWDLRANTSQSVTNGINTITCTSTANDIGIGRSNVLSTAYTFYIYARINPQSSNNVSLADGGSGASFVVVANVWQYISGLRKPTDATMRIFQNMTVGQTLLVDYVGAINTDFLKTNKQYSPLYNTTFDLMTDAQIKIQMDSWVQLGILPNANLQAITNTKVKTIGKNLFDKSKVSDGYILASNGTMVSSATYRSSDYIPIKTGNTYYSNQGASSSVAGYAFYDENKAYISGVVSTTTFFTFTAPANAKYVRYCINLGLGGNIDTAQLELGSTATTYAPYKSGTLELTHTPLYRLPNGVKDIVRYDNGQYVKDKYVQEYTLQASDIDLLYVSLGNLDLVGVKNSVFTNMKDYNTNDIISTKIFTTITQPRLSVTLDSLSMIGKHTYTTIDSVIKLYLGVPKGTYASLAQAQTALAGTKIYYQLATPLLANELVNADGQLIQENPTTIIQEQTLPSYINMNFTVDTKAQVIANKDAIVAGDAVLDTAKADKVVLTNLVTNGDLLIDSNADNIPDGFTLSNTTTYTLLNGIFKFTPNAFLGVIQRLNTSTYTIGYKYYTYSRVKTSSLSTALITYEPYATASHTGSGNYELLSQVSTKSGKNDNIQVGSLLNSGWGEIEVDYIGSINLTAIFGAGNEPTKEQMDAIMTLKGGYFSTTTLNVIDVMKLFAPKAQEAWLTPTLVNATQDATNPVQYMKDTLGFVHFRGKLTRTTAGSTILTLPTGYRIGKATVIPCVSGAVSFGVIQFVGTNGASIYLDAPSTPSLAFTFDGISYKAEA